MVEVRFPRMTGDSTVLDRIYDLNKTADLVNKILDTLNKSVKLVDIVELETFLTKVSVLDYIEIRTNDLFFFKSDGKYCLRPVNDESTIPAVNDESTIPVPINESTFYMLISNYSKLGGMVGYRSGHRYVPEIGYVHQPVLKVEYDGENKPVVIISVPTEA